MGLRLPRIWLFCSAFGFGAVAWVLLPSQSRSRQLSASHFIPAVLTSADPSGPDTKLLTLTVPPKYLPDARPFAFKSIWSVFIKDDDIQVERPYTPLEGIDDEGRMMFWIKKYDRGEVGRWLHSKKVGDTIELRGPSQTWQWKDDVWDEVIMVCPSPLQ
jgi:cytochrome-b5 reductase